MGFRDAGVRAQEDGVIIDGLLGDGLVDSEISYEVFFSIRADQGTGDGSRANPYRANSAEELDSRLLNLPQNARINFGPGLFRTKGGNAWLAQNGQKIVGVGIFSTTLRLIVDSDVTPVSVNAIGSDQPITDLLVSDLTIDCYMRGQAPHSSFPLFARVTPQAIGVGGRNITVRRVRVIDFGTKWKDMEGFPIYLQGPDTEDSLIGL